MTRVLILDNRDSFVWNLAQALDVLGARTTVVRSDEIDAAGVTAFGAQAIVLSPGPGRPEGAGCCVDVVREFSGRLPILGVCLGHQAIGVAFGARVDRTAPCHGKAWPVEHQGEGLFAGLESPLEACRYHSLGVLDLGAEADLVADAWTPEGVTMSMRHREHPTFGLQFHPESFRSPKGPTLLANFLEHAR